MTSISKIKSTIESLEDVYTDLKTAYFEIEDDEIKDLFNSMMKEAEEVINKLNEKFCYIE